MDSRIQSAVSAATSALEAKISAASNIIIDWVLGLLNRNNLVLLGSFPFSIAQSDWTADANGGYSADLPNAWSVSFPESNNPQPLAFYSFSGNSASAYNLRTMHEVTSWRRSSNSKTGRACVIRAYAPSVPESANPITGVCYVFGIQKAESPVNQETSIASINGVTVNGRQITVVISCDLDEAKLYCVIYNSNGQALSTLPMQNVAEGQFAYGFTMNEDHDLTSDYVKILLVNSVLLPVDTYVYEEEAEETVTEPANP